MLIRLLLLCVFSGGLAFAQQGDKPGEVQKPLVPKELIPPSPVLSPEQALKSFKLAPGFRIELVAAEPLVHDPVAIQFDADGRLWVVEMRGYMPDADGRGESEKVGSIAVLEDTDGDGRMDKRTTFLDQLVMPRAISLVHKGVLISEPPKLWFWRDTNGDFIADEKEEIAKDYATQADPALGPKASPEHASNGLMWALDNWIYSANHTTRFRYFDGEWKREPTTFRGQWGISQDDFGRLVFNSNSDQLRIDLVPSAYLTRNPYFRGAAGLNVDPVKDQRTYPARVTPGINRGYQAPMLRDGKLAKFTAACGPVIYRGDQFPPEFRGNAFVCEPSGNLIKRNILTERDGIVSAKQAYADTEFLASTDERFRPVNAGNGPDGALYIVDMYRGILQHRIFLTTYLRQQIVDRGLEKPVGLGRIYRIVYAGKALGPKPQLSRAGPEELVQHLSHPNGWWRDTAQRLLVERNSAASLEPLKKLATTAKNPLASIHALWTLDGLGQLDTATVKTALANPNTKVRATAIRLSEPFLKSDAKEELLPLVLKQLEAPQADVQLQLAFTLGEAKDPQAEKALGAIALKYATNVYLRDAIVTGLFQRELEFIDLLVHDKKAANKVAGLDTLLSNLARCLTTEARTNRVERLLEIIGAPATASWQRLALLDGIAANVPKSTKGKPSVVRPRVVRFASEPPAWAALLRNKEKSVVERVAKASPLIYWPGKPGVPPEPEVKPLTAPQQAQFETGRMLYEATCAACHQPHGFGLDGLAPPLVDSEWVLGTEQRSARIILHGLSGRITVKGQKYDLDMPAFGSFDDEQLAALLTYIRREWGHTGNPVSAATIQKIRAATSKRENQWTEAELLKVK
ncbi:MAG: c-type cytochrome [Verrucomicrobiota bacterium]